MRDEYDPETYRAWALRVAKFLANWPYDGLFADPPFRPTRKGEDHSAAWTAELRKLS